MANNLLIVESPGKVKKIQSILGSGWVVQASVGHVRDLPTKEIGVEPPEFRPHYVPTERGKSVIAKLKQCVGAAQEVYLATDPDREGESISWHLKQVLGLTSPKRVTFNEITPAAVKAAVAQPRTIDTKLVAAQEARRVLDRLVGYTVSPRLSDALGQTASAGRVQTPALRLVVEREREIRAFKPTKHFGVQLLFSGPQGDWIADWNCKPLLPKGPSLLAERSVCTACSTSKGCRRRGLQRGNNAPGAASAAFTTSTMQQGASAALKLNPKSTMQAAQRLYEQGAITYHRTDNPNLSADAIAELIAYAQAAGLPLAPKQRRWKAKDGAQEAHEAIRPTHFEVESAGESADERRLYQLIRLRALASQLADAVYDVRTLILRADLPIDGKRIEFIARGRTLKVAGWLSLTQSDATDESEQAEPDNPVPKLAEMDTLTAKDGKLLRKVTEPPRRYTQASLVKALEEEGIGRPATYAAIMDNIVSRDYVREEKKKFLVPTELGESVIDALVGRFAFCRHPVHAQPGGAARSDRPGQGGISRRHYRRPCAISF
jgi:DNA topoisomerase-1